MFLKMLEFSLALGFIWILIFQIIIPYVTERPFFPMFRRTKQLEIEIVKANEAVDEATLEKRAAEIRDNIKN